MRFAIGLDPFPGPGVHLARWPTAFLLVDLSWWLLETVLAVGLNWRAVRAYPISVRIWLAVVWVLASASRFLLFLAPS
ncbi:hypothetical protein [Pseudofrankia asymbiotica]|uniref:Uncharacterized protein n=1 Tax=Pseudofrankia asymbiotica TaxID=1834516 RepID=A0A1V2I2L9_9ACTN|nr:hypothetical protein [Pseudofrankia asymbiotica]ONH24170.1 hypothetical protein BL253_30905 [Pseudofrankia asymbiotica]